MALSEIELLRLPVDASHPCGEDLEYDPEFLALQQALQGKREQQFGTTIIPAELPDWSKVERIAKQLCQRTRDLRVLVPLTLAWTENRGLPGYAEGLRSVDAMLASFWDDLHPRLVLDDGHEDPLPRMNALAALAESEGVGRAVRDAPLVVDGGASLTLRQVEALLDASRAEQVDYPGGLNRLRETVRDADDMASPSLRALREALELLQRIRETAERALGQSWAPDFSRLERSMRTVAQLLPEQAPGASMDAAPPDAGMDGANLEIGQTASAGAAGHDSSGSGGASRSRTPRAEDVEIVSRADVQVLLEKACRYLERAEPSHPAPMLIRRAQKLLDLNFFQIIEELLPEGVQRIESLAGRSIVGAAGEP